MFRRDFIVRAVAAAVCWLALIVATAALMVGAFFGTYPGPYGGHAIAGGALVLACLAGALFIGGVPARFSTNR